MPRLNSKGEYAMGIAGIQGSVNGVLVPDSYGPYWINDDEVIFGQPSNLILKIMNVDSSVRRDASPNSPYNELRAGGNNWAGFIAVPALVFAPNLHLPDAYLHDVGPDGAIGFRTLYHSNFGVEVFELNGERWLLNNTDIIYDLQLLGAKRAIWKNQDGHRIRTHNIPPCIQIGNAWRPRAVFINDEWWVCYFSDAVGLVLHPFNSTIGYTITPPGVDAFGHDAVALGSFVKVAWSTTQGELPQHYRDRVINIATEPRQELSPTVTIPVIGKPCWCCWFEFVNDLAYLPPGNSFMWVKQGGIITKADRTQFAAWVQIDPGNPATHSVEFIEQQCNNNPLPCVAYWDSRVWPRLPNIKSSDWTAIQAYCRVGETPQRFEIDLRNYINTLPQDRKYCLVCQCYSDNASLTKDLIGIVPVYAALARDYKQINFLMPFNDQGRGNAQVGGGLQWNPQVKPYWDQLFAGITGEPSMANPQLPPEVCEALHRERNKYGTPPTGSELCKILNDAAWSVGQGADWGVNRKDFGTYVESPERPEVGKIAHDILHRKSDNMIWDVLIAAGEASTVNCGEALGEMTDSRRPWVAPQKPPDVVEPEPVSVVIYYNDPVAKRSDPFGCLIKYEVASSRPITRAEFYCEGNGENPVAVEFPVGPGYDGRYIRQIGVKFTVNGTWVLRVKGFNDQGQEGISDGTHRVEVTF
jgi:hypothetical protein